VQPKLGKPIVIYQLAGDPGESHDLAAEHPEQVRRAEAIFAEAHRAHPEWPLDRRSEGHERSNREAWKIKHERDRTGWIPPNAKPYTP